MPNLKLLHKGKAWNAEPTQDGTGTEFHVGWVNYLDANEDWQNIDCTLIPTNGGFEMKKAPFEVFIPEFSDGTATLHNNNRFDIADKVKIDEDDLDMSITAKDVNVVKGKLVTGSIFTAGGDSGEVTHILYEGAYDDADLIYYIHYGNRPTLQKLVRFNQAPTQLEYVFELEYDKDIDMKIRGQKWSKAAKANIQKESRISSMKKNSNLKGIDLDPFFIWDSNEDTDSSPRNVKPIDADIVHSGNNKFTLTKKLPQSFFDDNPVYPVYTDTVSTFYTNGTYEDGQQSQDDGVTASTSWSTWVDAATCTHPYTVYQTNNVYSAGDNQASGRYWLHRWGACFDTSAIDTGDEITAATFRVYAASGMIYTYSPTNDYVRLVTWLPANYTTFVVGDYDSFGSTAGAPDFDVSAYTQYAAAYFTFTLNATGEGWIDKDGVTYLGMRHGGDIEKEAPPTTSTQKINGMANVRMNEYAGTTYDPLLTITHAAPGPANVKTIHGVATANVKTVNTVAIANVKKINASS